MGSCCKPYLWDGQNPRFGEAPSNAQIRVERIHRLATLRIRAPTVLVRRLIPVASAKKSRALFVTCLRTNPIHSMLILKIIPKLIYPERRDHQHQLRQNIHGGLPAPMSQLGDTNDSPTAHVSGSLSRQGPYVAVGIVVAGCCAVRNRSLRKRN